MKLYLRHIILWILSLAILNTSVDVADNYYRIPGNTIVEEFYEIESIAEFLFNEAMDESFPDQKGNDTQGMVKKTASFDFTFDTKRNRILPQSSPIPASSYTGTYYTIHLSPGFRTIFSPPPNC